MDGGIFCLVSIRLLSGIVVINIYLKYIIDKRVQSIKITLKVKTLNMASVCPKGIEQKIRLMLESGYVAEPSVLTKKTSKSMKRGHHLQNRNAKWVNFE